MFRLIREFLRKDPINLHKLDVEGNEGFRRASVHILGLVLLALLLAAGVLNVYEGSPRMALPLLAAGGVIAAALLWLHKWARSSMGPLLLLSCCLLLLGVYLLLAQGVHAGGSLFFFIIFPPMVMLCAGLRLGSLFFALLYLILLALLLTPLRVFLAEPVSNAVAVRLLLAMLGSFVFSWCAEYIRYQTRCALEASMCRLEQDALTDPLTGLGNRRDFQNYFSWVAARADRNGIPFAVAMIDLDHFKKVNDTYGHDVGDRVLRHVTGTMQAHMRSMDRLFRWGGEEFLWLMPETSGQDALKAAERLRRSVEETPFEQGKIKIAYTISIGMHSRRGGTADEHIAAADRNLYSAKSEGRNRVAASFEEM